MVEEKNGDRVIVGLVDFFFLLYLVYIGFIGFLLCSVSWQTNFGAMSSADNLMTRELRALMKIDLWLLEVPEYFYLEKEKNLRDRL